MIAFNNQMLVQAMEMPTEADILVHTQNVTDDCHVFFSAKTLALVEVSNGEYNRLSIILEFISLIGRCFSRDV